MGNPTCASLATQYVISSDPYYKIHILITLIVYILSYIYYLKDETFEEYDNKFVVFLSKFILLPIALNYIIALLVGLVIGYIRKPLIDLTVKKCPIPGKEDKYITNNDLRTIKQLAREELIKLTKGSSATSSAATGIATTPITPSSILPAK